MVMAMAMENVDDVYALSPLQQGILFHTLYEQGSGLYFEQSVSTLEGVLDPERFREAWQRVLDRHPALRVSLHWEDLAHPVQVVHRAVALPFHFEDWRAVDHEDDRLEAFLREDRARGFTLSEPPLLRIALFRTGDLSWKLVLSFQHALLDRWSRFLILEEAMANDERLSRGERAPLEPARPYGSYIAWLREQDPGAAETFWRKTLRGFEKPTILEVGSGGEARPPEGFVEQRTVLGEEATARVSAFGRSHGLTLNTLVQGAWSILVSRYSGETDVLTGATVAGRPPDLPDVESIVGLFINTLPVRVAVSPGDRLVPWLRNLQERLAELRQYGYSSLLDIQQWSEIPRGQPLFGSLLVFENVARPTGQTRAAGPLRLVSTRSVGSRTNYPVTLLVLPGPTLAFRLSAAAGRFSEEAAARMLGHLRRLLEAIPEDAERSLSRLPLLTEPERRQILHVWNETARDHPGDETLVSLFEQQADSTPEAPALVFGRDRWTYRQLDGRANQIAQRLQREGAGVGTLVGICTNRSPEMVAGILGILKAGAAYVPLDPAYPRKRLEDMLEDADVSIVLTERSLAETLSFGQARPLRLDADAPLFSGESEARAAVAIAPRALAYVIYTSGSTGRPKGVAIEHGNAAALVHWAKGEFSPEELSGVLASTSICFDLSVFEIFVPLASGGTVILAQNALDLPTLPAAGEVSLVNTVPSAMTELLRLASLPASVRAVNLAGEPLPSALVRSVFASGRVVKVRDLYGPSEDTTYSTGARRFPDGPVTIGRPLTNKYVYILDAGLEPAPVGVAGDLYVGGSGVARGYLNKPDATAERFLPDPHGRAPSARIYRTGDRARYLPDGNIEFLGRLDDQVKVRGYRIELKEIEAALEDYSGIRAAVVMARDQEGAKELVAYLVMDGKPQAPVSALRGFLKTRLADFMVPSTFVFLESLPLTPNGKVDRRALPAPDRVRPEGERFVAPRTPVESQLAAIWTKVLRVDGVGVHDNFFELGGHSLLATQVISRVAESFGLRMPLRSVFEEPVLEDFAVAIARGVSDAERDEVLRLVAEVRSLTDEEARSRLASEPSSDRKGTASRTT